jgi:hypothetical protein
MNGKTLKGEAPQGRMSMDKKATSVVFEKIGRQTNVDL